MNLLSIEMSTSRGSVALFEDDTCSGSIHWESAKRRGEDVLTHLLTLLKENKKELKDVDIFAVGLGPGNYSGMRIALTTAQALALPESKKVIGISSGHALAQAAVETYPSSTLAVLGDARRNSCWLSHFKKTDDWAVQTGSWELIPYEKVVEAVSSADLVLSPDRTRLQEVLQPLETLVKEDLFPSAEKLGELALHCLDQELPTLPLTPLYMHPAVQETKKA